MRRPCLHAHSFEYTRQGFRWDNSVQLEPCRIEQSPELGFSALATSDVHQHVHIAPGDDLGSWRRINTVGHGDFHQQELGLRRHHPVTVPEDGGAASVVPVMDDTLEDVGVAALGLSLEEIPGDHLTAAGEAGGLNRLPGNLSCKWQLAQ